MQRILVTGNAGSGKTSLGNALAHALSLPYVGLDSIVWKPGWVSTPRLERDDKEHSIAQTSAWVVDGVSKVFLEAADTVVFLDVPRRTCFRRALWRNLRYLFRSRPGLPERCPEIMIVPKLMKIIWRFPKQVRPQILEARRSKGKRFFHIRSSSELNAFLDSARLSAQRLALIL